MGSRFRARECSRTVSAAPSVNKVPIRPRSRPSRAISTASSIVTSMIGYTTRGVAHRIAERLRSAAQKHGLYSCRPLAVGRQKIEDHLAEHHELGEIGWLAEIPVCAKGVHFRAIAARIRRRYYDNDSAFASRTGAKLTQYVTALVARHVDVQ